MLLSSEPNQPPQIPKVAGVFESSVKTTATTFSPPEGQPEHAPPPPRPFGLVATLIRSTPSVSRAVSKPRSESLLTPPTNPTAPVPTSSKMGYFVSYARRRILGFAVSSLPTGAIHTPIRGHEMSCFVMVFPASIARACRGRRCTSRVS